VKFKNWKNFGFGKILNFKNFTRNFRKTLIKQPFDNFIFDPVDGVELCQNFKILAYDFQKGKFLAGDSELL